MNLNPLEGKKNTYEINDLFTVDNSKEYSWDRMSQNKNLPEKYNKLYGYDYLLYTITDEIEWIINSDCNNYQGSIYYLGKDKDEKYYFLDQGYGSCSGCDAYQACENNIEELDDLRESMKRDIKQFDNLEEFKEYITNDIAKGNYYYYDDDFKEFIELFNNMFGISIEIKRDEDEE